VYTKNDPLNCGACGQKCSNNGIDNPTCVDGGCSGTCNSGFAACPDDAGKVNRLTNGCGTQVSLDPNNCGHCGLVCSGFNMADAAGHCDKSECQAECVSPYAYCGDAGIHPSDASHDGGDAGDAHVVAPAVYPTLAEAGCNINLNSDIYNCGACGRVCNQLHVQTVQCKFSPDAGIAECLDFCENGWGACNNPQQNGCDTFVKGNDPNNCSGCGTKSAPYPCCGGQPNTSGQPCTIEAGI
jgi:hypothetical protein